MNIAVYCGSNPGANPRFAEAAIQLGNWIGEHGHTLIYGGSAVGMMGAIARAVMSSGGTAIGVEPRFFIEAGVAQEDLSELIVVEDMPSRKQKMLSLADAFVALPGGVGTLEEISEVMSCIRLGLGPRECFFLNIDGFWEPIKELASSMQREGFIEQQDLDRYIFPESLSDLEQMLVDAELNPRPQYVSATELMHGKRMAGS